MKLLLTSTGFASQSIGDKFLELAGKKAGQAKVVLVPTAARTKEELGYVQESKQELLDLGILPENIGVLELDKPVSPSEVDGFDAMYVCGGNTFYIMQKVRENGFDQAIKKFVADGKLYFGVSAGSILVCPDISIAGPWDENDVGLKDMSGLGLVDFIVSPHYVPEEKEMVDGFAEKLKHEIIRLTDDQALLVVDGKHEKIT